MKFYGRVAVLALAALAAQPAHASDKQDFATCDGRKHPGKSDDGMRGEASRPGFDFAGFGSSTPAPGPIVAACTRALESPRLLASQNLRRAHLLRARAVAYLQAKDPARALADLDRADAAVGSLRGEPFYRRSIGASIVLLRALAKAQSGEAETALALAREAAEARPYSPSVQYVAASVIQSARPIGEASPSPWSALVRLEPSAAATALVNEAEVGNFAGVLALRPTVELTWPGAGATPQQRLGGGAGPDFATLMVVGLNSAYAYAANGDAAAARAELTRVEAGLAAASLGPQATRLFSPYAEIYRKLVEARIAVADGRHGEAVGALVGARLPDNAASLELLEALAASAPADMAALVPDVSAWRTKLVKNRGEGLGRLSQQAVIAPETARAVIDYERSRPNILGEFVGAAFSLGTTLLDGIDRKDGFRSTDNADGTVKVEFIGNTPSAPMVQEMTLLRAAELARAAGKAGFVIVDRHEYTRTLQMTRGGTPVSSTPQGFKSELTIRFVESGAEPERALDALAVIDALGPLYYQAAEPRIAAR